MIILSKKELSYTASMGTLWGISEITLGFVLHNLHIPFTGLIQTLIGAVIALTAMSLTGRKRTIIYTAIIAATIKMLSFTTVKIFPFIGILCSSIVGQAVIYAFGINLLSLMLAGGMMCCWPFAQSLLVYLIVYSPRLLDIYQNFLYKIGIENLTIASLIIWIFIIHFIVGVAGALFSWKVSKELKIRLNQEE